MFELGVFNGYKSFIVKSQVENFKDTGGIFDSKMGLLAYFKHEHTWRSPRGPIKVGKQARATDIYLKRADDSLFGEINEIPPKLISMQLIRTFEIYDERKELVAVVKEKPKAFGSADWVLLDLQEKVIASIVGDRKKKEYEIQSSGGQAIARCSRDSSLGKNSYRVDVFGGGDIDMFLILCYVVVLDLAKAGWTTREGLFINTGKEVKKEHLVKTQEAQASLAKTQDSQSLSKYAKINAVLSVVQAGLVFALATSFLGINSESLPFSLFFGNDVVSYFLFAFGVALLVTAFVGVTFVKLNQFNQVAMLMGAFGVFSLFIGSVMLSGGFVSLPSGSTMLVVGMMVVGFGILANLWLLIGLFDSFIKK